MIDPPDTVSARDTKLAALRGRSRIGMAANALMLLVFAFSALVQINDPDPLPWIAVYAGAALVCAVALTRRVHPVFPMFVGTVALTWASTLAPRVVGIVPVGDMFAEFEMRNTAIEEAREMYGLLIVALWMAAVAVSTWRRRIRSGDSAQRPERSEHGVGVP